MKIEFTKEEARQFLELMRDENDIVRLVDPVAKKVLQEDGENLTGEACHTVWGRCERCENCTSLRALQRQDTAYKLEIFNGHTYWVCSRFLKTEGHPGILELVKDVTDRLIMDTDQRDQIGMLISNYNQMLITDSLTGVYNRRFLDEHFLPSLKCCHEEDITVNLAFIDMDGFKEINDRYGHNAGDRLLKDVAGFWKLHFNRRDKGKERLVIRFGGDELLVIACGIPQHRFEEEIHHYNNEMRKICYLSDQTQFGFDFTYGIASSETLGRDWEWEDLIEAADRMMYQGKDRKAKAGTDVFNKKETVSGNGGTQSCQR
ncbi:GGDEF domain-containing protein [Acidaminobacterium chupaoyuni]